MYTNQICVDNFYSPPITSTSLCPTSPGECEKTCTNSTVTYSVELPDSTTAFWQVDGAEDFTIGNGEVEVMWGEEGEGEVSVDIFESEISEMNLDCGQGLIQPDVGTNDNHFAFLNVQSTVGQPYEFSADGGATWQEFQTNSIGTFDNLSEGIYDFIVRNASGQTGECSVEITPNLPFDATVVPVPSANCFLPNAYIIIKGNYFFDGLGQIGYDAEIKLTNLSTGEVTIDTGLITWTGPSQMTMNNLPFGDYEIQIQDLNSQNFVVKYFSIGCLPDCQISSSLCIDIQPEPQANFTTEPAAVSGNLSLCQGQSIQFENASTGSTSVIWEFGNGATTPAENPEYTYPEPGVYEVKLIARNDCLCADTTTMTVEITDAQIPDIQCIGTVCEGDTATYSTTVDCNFYQWEISPAGEILAGGGTDDDFVTVAWTAGPSGWVQLQTLACAGSVCADPVRENIGIIPGQLWADGPQIVCPHQIAEYSVPDFGATDYIWYVPTNLATILSGQGTPKITVEWGEHPGGNTPQLAQINVEYENCFLGCGGQGAISVQMKQPSFITGPIEICMGDSPVFKVEIFSGNNGGGTWEITSETGGVVWESGSASSQISPTWDFPAGQYIVRLNSTSSATCSENAGLNVELLAPPPPVDGITGDAFICPEGWYSYEAESNLPGATFSWQVLNGPEFLEKTGRTVNVQWGGVPPMQVSVSQKTGGAVGCPSPFFIKEIKNIPEIAISGPVEICKESTETYTADFYQNVDYQWVVEPSGAGGIISGQGTEAVEIFWQRPGMAEVKLIACGENTPLSVTVFSPPKPEIMAPVSLCPGETGAVSATQNFVFYRWENENGQILSSLPNPSFGPGTYALFATDNNGCEGKTSFTILEKPGPETNISTPDHVLCPAGETTTLYALQTEDGLTYSWSFGGSQIGTDSPTLDVAVGGTYSLLATDAEGCSTALSFEVDDCPVGGGGGGSGGGGGNDPIGGGGTCTPADSLGFATAPGGDCAGIVFQSTSPAAVPGSFNWFFRNSTGTTVGTSTQDAPLFTFPEAGYFEVSVYAMMPDSADPTATCLTRAAGIVAVPLKARFEAIENCPGLPTAFTDLSTFLPGTGITSWAWDFGDPASGGANFSPNQHPEHTFQSPGNYVVTLTVTSTEGCESVFIKNVESHAAPDVAIPPPFGGAGGGGGCAASALGFMAETSPNAVSVTWDFGDPASGEGNFSQSENPFHVYPAAGEYTVVLTAENIYGCANSASQNVDIGTNNLTGEITPNDPAPFCEGSSINLVSPPGGVSWLWSNGGAENTISVSQSNVYEVTLTDANGCEYSPPGVPVEVIPAPEATIRAMELNEFGQPVAYHEDGISACEGEAVFLEMVGLPKYTYEWSNGSVGTQLTLSAAGGNLLPAGNHVFTVTVTDTETGCTSVEGPFPVDIHGAPTDVEIISMPDGPICEGTEALFSVVNPQPDLAYLWNTGQSGTEMTAVSAGTYLVQATNVFGCAAISEAIEIHSAPPVGAIPMGCFTSCEPMQICLPDMPDVSDIQWFINGAAVPPPTGNLTEWTTEESGEYSVHLTTIYGCETLAEGLSLDIAPQSGDLFGEVWEDVDGDGQIDPSIDSLLPGAYVEIFQDGGLLGFQLTGADGSYFFGNFPVGEYDLNLNLANLPTYQIVGMGTINTSLTGCSLGDGFDFLVENLCAQPLTASLEMSACPDGSAIFDGVEIAVGASADFHFTSFLGCDSMLTVSVIELPTSTGTLELAACPGGTAEFLGSEIPAGGSEVFVLENYLGCDSMLTVSVIELPTSLGSLELFACPDAPVIYGGQTMWPGDVANFILENQAGCDSILTVSVTSILADTTFLELDVCDGETIEYQGFVLSQNETRDIVLTSSLGCDSVVRVTVIGLPEIAFSMHTEEICHGTAKGLITVDVSSGTPPYSCSLDGQNFQTKPNFTDLEGGTYTVWVQDAEGCLGSAEIKVEEMPPLHVIVDDYALPCDEEMVVIRPVVTSYAGAVKWQWENGSHEKYMVAEKAGIYAFEVEDDCAVEARAARVDWGDNVPEDFLYVPNAFSPNEDRVNDVFRTYAPEGGVILNYEFRVFDRWGGLVFETFDQTKGWDGYVDGSLQNTGVYVWYVRATVEICGIRRDVFLEGDVMLMR